MFKKGGIMKTVGLLGGMSWESSLEYYRIINELVKERLGGAHSCKSIMYSVDFAEIEELQHKGKWNELTEMMIDGARKIEKGGADFLLICTNTMHKMAEEVENSINIPLIHIADVTAERIKNKDIKRVGLLGTRFTMEEDFYKGRLKEKHNIDVITPDSSEQEKIHQNIFEELVQGKIKESSRSQYRKIIKKLVKRGAEGVILGCTEIPLLVRDEDSEVPLFDTTRIHAMAAVKRALEL